MLALLTRLVRAHPRPALLLLALVVLAIAYHAHPLLAALYGVLCAYGAYWLHHHRVRVWHLKRVCASADAALKSPKDAGARITNVRGYDARTGSITRSFELHYSHRVRDGEESLRAAVDAQLAAKLGQQLRAHWDTERNVVHYEVVQPLPEPFAFPPRAEYGDHEQGWEPLAWWRLWLGLTEHAKRVYVDLRRFPHLLVIAPTRSGKTSFLRMVCAQFRALGFQVWTLDGKLTGLRFFRPFAAWWAAGNTKDIRELLAKAETEMKRRYALLEADQFAGTPPLAIVFDEVTSAVQREREAMKTKGTPPILVKLQELARMAGEVHMSLFVGLQRPDVEYLGGEARDNFGTVIVCAPLGPQGSQMVFGNQKTGRAPEFGGLLPSEPGRALAVIGGAVVPLRIPWLADPHNPDHSEADRAAALEWFPTLEAVADDAESA